MLVAAQNLQSIKTFLTLELSQYSKSGSMVSSRSQSVGARSEPVGASSDISRLGNARYWCSPVQPAQAGRTTAPELGA